MKHTRTIMTAALLAAGCWFWSAGPAGGDSVAAAARGQVESRRPVDLVICLDTSGSMNGLIESAKQKLWAVVNELATAKPRPRLRVALYQYGNDGLARENGWVERICDLTDDLDTVYGKLFALRTNGGTEYVARVVRAAVGELDWSKESNALRVIFVAGNEPATQDKEFPLKDTCAAAAGKGIVINTIHCGDEETGRRTGWADAALWADGRYAAIDQDHGTVIINTPYDQQLSELSRQVNDTYVPYGPAGAGGGANQAAQDANAATLGVAAEAQRAAGKSTTLYSNSGWDLVDASREASFDLAKVEEEHLPAEMRGMTLEQRKAHLEAQAKRRDGIRKQIQELSEKRQAFAKKEMERQGLSEEKSFDAALRTAVRQQAESKGFEFEKGTN